MSDEVGEKVGQNSEQGQTADAVAGKNPGAAAFMMPNGGCGRWRLLTTRRDNRGPIFHAKNLPRKDRGARTLCVTPAPLHGVARLSKRDSTPDLGRRGEKLYWRHGTAM